MKKRVTQEPKLYGILELDTAGTVLYSRIEGDSDGQGPVRDLKGRNFFTEVAPFRNVDEFRHRLEDFRHGWQQFSSGSFICQYEDGPLPVKVILARVPEREAHELTKSILVQIREAD